MESLLMRVCVRVCIQNSKPLWKITLWGTVVEAIPHSEGKVRTPL